jgi:hypothetical protein
MNLVPDLGRHRQQNSLPCQIHREPKKKETDLETGGSGERIAYDEIFVMPEPNEARNVNETDEGDKEEDSPDEDDEDDEPRGN